MLPVKNIEIYLADNIINLEEASKLIKKLKENGKTVGLCCGKYDLLHPGHVIHFYSAKKLCDSLFVAITANKIIQNRGNPNRPVLPEILRAYMISSIKPVDYVLVYPDETGANTIKKLRPSFFIKGPFCKSEDSNLINPERQAIEEVGGEIRYTQDPILSTTEIINYIKNKY